MRSLSNLEKLGQGLLRFHKRRRPGDVSSLSTAAVRQETLHGRPVFRQTNVVLLQGPGLLPDTSNVAGPKS